jgi:hypothetical protein
MKRPSGVRAAETMTTGSEAVAMAGAPQFFRASDSDLRRMTFII